MHINCPHCHNGIEVVEEASLTDITCPTCDSNFSLVGPEPEVTVDVPSSEFGRSFDQGELERTVDHASFDPDQTREDIEETLPQSGGHPTERARSTRPMRMIGRFNLISEVGKGAFGSVWLGKDPKLDRTVAVKVPRKGQLTPKESEQFFREARAAAQLKHPNIVPVHEIGKDGDTIYIVSDFVKGDSLSERLKERPMGVRASSELCIKVAMALAHAHEKGVVHRDLKPANIMLDDQDEPFVMDFGLAKRDAGEITMTMDGQILGTPAYMSPEQASGDAHSTDGRTDVYSIGVILFKMLTGELPFRGNTRMLIHQVINEEPPSPLKLDSNIDKDLATITVKCMEKDPDKRYPTANDLADDLKCYLDGKPISARPVSNIERAWRWCKRKPALASAIASSLFLLTSLAIGGPIAASYQANLRNQAEDARTEAEDARTEAVDAKVEAENARKAAVSAKNEADDASKKFQEEANTNMEMLEIIIGAFTSVDPDKGATAAMTAKDVLFQAYEAIEKTELEELSRARLLSSLTTSFIGLGEYRQAILTANKAVSLREKVLGPEHPDTVSEITNLAASYMVAGQTDIAIELFEKTLLMCRKIFGPEHPTTIAAIGNLAVGYEAIGRTEKAITLKEERLTLSQQIQGDEHLDTVSAMGSLAISYHAAGRTDEAIKLQKKSLLLSKQIRGPKHPDTLTNMGNLSVSYKAVGQMDEALKLDEESLLLSQEILGPQHPSTLNAMGNLAISYKTAGRVEEAITLEEKSLAISKQVLGSKHRKTLKAMGNLAISYKSVGRAKETLELQERTFSLRKEVLGPEHPDTLTSMGNLAITYSLAGRDLEALVLDHDALSLWVKTLGSEHPYTLRAKDNLADSLSVSLEKSISLLAKNKLSDAESLLVAMGELHGPHKSKIKLVPRNLHIALLGQRKWKDGLEAIDEWQKTLNAPVQLTADDPIHATAGAGNRNKMLAWAKTSQAVCLLELGKFKKAEETARKAIASEKITGSNRHRAGSVLAVCLARQNKFDVAEDKAIAAYTALEGMIEVAPEHLLWYIPRAAERVIKVYELADKPEQVKKWKAKLAEIESKIKAQITPTDPADETLNPKS